MKHLLQGSLALALAAPCLAQADTSTDLRALQQEVANLRASYEARIRALEAKLQAAEAAAPAVAAAPAPAAVAAVTPAAAPAASTGSGFNPAISLILSGQYNRNSRDPEGYRIRGIPLPPDAEIGPGSRGFSLAESELAISGNIDPYFSGAAHVALSPENEVSVEEAYVQTTALGHGLTVKGGRFFSGIGYLNSQHAHQWDFVDAPLAYQALLGTQFADDGLQFSWLAPTEQFIQLRAEMGRGRSYPGGDSSGNGAGAFALAAHTGGDVGASHSWRAGLSYLRTRAADQQLAAVDADGADITNAFTGNTGLYVADFVWKWAPEGNATRTNFKLQGEYLRATREGSLVTDLGGAATAGDYRATQSGWYLQGVYQFMPRWRAGLRTERVAGDTSVDGAARKNTAMVDYAPSEFSRLRLQYARDRSRPGEPDNQVWLQYQMSLGAHGAHGF